MLDFDALYAQYHDAILRYCFRHVYDFEDAKELTQETFISILKMLPRLEQQEGLKINAYIYRAANNKCLDFLRHKKLIQWCELDDEQPHGNDFTECIEVREEIGQTLDVLTPFHRETLVAWLYDKRESVHGSGWKMAVVRARRSFQEAYGEREVNA